MRSLARVHLVHLKRLFTRLQTLLESSGDSPNEKQIHKIRVTTRRIRAALRLAEKSDCNMSFKRATRKLRRLGKTLGRGREMDVAMHDAHDFHIESGALRRRHEEARAEVTRVLQKKRRQRLIGEVEKAIFEVEKRPPENLDIALFKLLKNVPSWKMVPLRNKKRIHEFRIAIKKIRYALESVGKPVGPLPELQDHLGRAHDLETLCKLARPNLQAKRIEKQEIVKAKQLAKPAVLFAAGQLSH